ncbi:SIS domain-containing protein [Paenibacillus sp. 1P07SE]|uniref:SIS domain-containing protein n=1 Tax=Paenibacillus sp. 1P07SE TaxID=3132209 RepID=UPI0039A567A9
MMTSFGQLTYPEIREQNEALTAAWEQLSTQKEWIDAYLADHAFKEVLFIGSGSSYYQALIMAATFRSWLARRAAACPSSEIMLFPDHAAAPGKKLLVAVSRSGESSEAILAVQAVKDLPDWTVCGVTCYPNSSLAALAPCLISPLGAEQSTVMTKSFSSMTYLMQAAIAAASGSAEHLAQLKQTIDVQAPLIEEADRLAQRIIQENELFAPYIYLGMGPFFGAAQEACLKIKEMAQVWTESYGTLEFRHGPKSIIEPGALVVLLLSEQARIYEVKAAQEMQDYGAKVLVITAAAGEDLDFADYVFDTRSSQLDDNARVVTYMPLVQFLGYYSALSKNTNPDEPRNLSQVVTL